MYLSRFFWPGTITYGFLSYNTIRVLKINIRVLCRLHNVHNYKITKHARGKTRPINGEHHTRLGSEIRLLQVFSVLYGSIIITLHETKRFGIDGICMS